MCSLTPRHGTDTTSPMTISQSSARRNGTEPDADTQLTVRGLCKQFGEEFCLSDIDLTVGSDEIVALLGPSGCGKTTTLRCIAGVETPDDGRIHIDGDLVFGDGHDAPPERRDVGMVYQSYAIWPHKSVYENVVFPLEHADHDVPADEYDRRVREMLELMEIGDLVDNPATDLSGGQQQRTALARSLVHDPNLLLLDEPLSNLDKELRKQMRYELQRIQHELGVSMLYVTHSQEEAFYLADRVLVMNDGGLVECGTPRQLYERPKSPFTRQFIGVRNCFSGTIHHDSEAIVHSDLVEFPLETADYVANGNETDDVTCFLRPDDITLDPAREPANGHVEVGGSVVAEGLLGEHYEVSVKCENADVELVVHTNPSREFDRGDSVRLRFQPERLQVYESDR